MTAQLLKKQEREISHNLPADGIELRVRDLVRQVTGMVPSALLTDSDGDELILDVEVDGVRCLLLRTRQAPEPHHAGLSPREVEIARMVAEGYPNKIIADVLDISSWTVGTHLRRIFAKLNVGSRAAMVAKLLEEGLLRDYAGRARMK